MCVCNRRHPAHNAHAPYIHLCPARFYGIFSTLSHKRYDFRKRRLLNQKCVFWFSLHHVRNISYSANCASRNKNEYRSSCKVLVFSYQILIKREFSRQIFEKFPKYQISWKSVQWEPYCSMRIDGRTDGQNDVTKLIEASRNFANPSKNCIIFAILFHSSNFHLFLRHSYYVHSLPHPLFHPHCLSVSVFNVVLFQLSVHS